MEPCGNDIVITGLKNFCLDDILDCGQCFRWDKLEAGVFRGVAFGLCRTVRQEGGRLVIYASTIEEFDAVWHEYFDFGRDYSAIVERLCGDAAMRKAVEFTPGMRVLRQEPWETLCSFILSQNNNIKRIRGLVSRLCENFGEKIDGGYAFPTAEKLAALSPEDLAPVRCGFRAGYVIDAARRVNGGEIDFEKIRRLPVREAGAELQKIHGVGPKVASCALLCGLGRAESLPVDVWIDRAIKAFYPEGMPESIADIAGIGQQYLFHYVRNEKTALTVN